MNLDASESLVHCFWNNWKRTCKKTFTSCREKNLDKIEIHVGTFAFNAGKSIIRGFSGDS